MRSIFKAITVVFLSVAALFIITAAWNVYYINVMKWTFDKSIVIYKGDKTDTIIEKVKSGNKLGVKVFLRISGLWKKLKPGNYELEGDYTLREVYTMIASGKSNVTKLVIPEGFTVSKVIAEAEKKGLATSEELRKALSEYPDFYYPHPNNNYEGYMYPATYSFFVGMTAEDIVRAILEKFLSEYPPEKYPDKEDFYKKLIMASIIEKEAYHADEKKVIASVFYNRLEKGQRFESCATVEYLYDYSKEKLYYNDLKIDSPYNTYLYKGLPPAPICNPSKESFEAAENPEKTKFLFFVAKPDRHHIFSETYKEHLKVQEEMAKGNK